MRQLFAREEPVVKSGGATIADGIAVKNPSREMYENFICKYVDEIVEVSDEEIAQAIVFLLERMKSVTEGSGAAGFAAVLSRKIETSGTVCVLLCGGNIDLNTMSRVIETGLRQSERLARVSMVVSDLPGNLHRLTGVFAEQNANILEVFHDRASSDLHLRETRIDFVIEIRNHEHLEAIKTQLSQLPGVTHM
jgi:threonine dehydratase